MDARLTQQELGFLLPANQPRGMQEAEALRLAAAGARDAAVGRFFKRAVSRAWSGLKALVEMPRRMAVYDELSALSDRELADIGMKRGDIQLLGVASYAALLLSTLALVASGIARPTWTIALAAVLITLGAALAALAGAKKA